MISFNILALRASLWGASHAYVHWLRPGHPHAIWEGLRTQGEI